VAPDEVVTTAELITLRYGGKSSLVARKLYALLLFSYAIIIIGYITGFFAKTIAPVMPLTETQILLVFGGVTVLYTVFGGLIGVVFTDVIQFAILLLGSLAFFFPAVPQHGGWASIVQKVRILRPETFRGIPPTPLIPALTGAMLVIQGLFLAGLIVLIVVSLMTRPESKETLVRFYERCRPPGFWKPVRERAGVEGPGGPSLGHLMFDSGLGIVACLGLVVATNAMFAGTWKLFGLGGLAAGGFGWWLIKRIL
jgi:hypothetical protein